MAGGETVSLGTVVALQRVISDDVKAIRDAQILQNGRLRQCEINIGKLQVKAALWGLAAGALPGIGAVLFWLSSR